LIKSAICVNVSIIVVHSEHLTGTYLDITEYKLSGNYSHLNIIYFKYLKIDPKF